MGKVGADFLKRVSMYQKKDFVRIGKFDLDMLSGMVDLLSNETSGEIELLMMADNIMHDGTTSGLLVVKYDGENYVALAGVTNE